MTDYRPLVGKQLLSYGLATAPGNLWEGTVRSSKTVVSILRWLDYIANGPPGPLAMIGKTERTLKRNVLDPIVGMIGSRRCKITVGTGEAKILGRTVYLAGANDERAAEKIQGMTLAGFYGDEISTWPENVFSIARTRLSIDGASWFGTTNPGAPNHWLKKEHIDRASLHVTQDGTILRSVADDRVQMSVFSFVLDDNPFLPAEFVARLKTEYVGMFYQRFILGKWAMAEGAIYDMWDYEQNTVERSAIPRIARWVSSGIDYGTTNPFHAVMIGLGVDRTLYVTDEWRYDSRKSMRQLTDAEYSQRLRRWQETIVHPTVPALAGVAPERVCVDPSAASFRVQLYRDGLASVAADNSVVDGIRVNAGLIAARKIKIARTCAALIEEIPSYAWDDRAAKLGRDEPIKANDHGCDAKRYGVKTTMVSWYREVYGYDPI